APAAEEAPAAPEAPAPPEAPATRTTPPRLSFFNGEVSFWRPGAEDWAPAHVNTPLAAGDSLYAGQGANLELQAGPRAYVRAGGEALDVGPNEEAIVKGTESPQVDRYAAPKLDAWDRWNYERSDQLLNPKSARYLPEGVSGGDDLDHYGRWHTEPDYGAVWV